MAATEELREIPVYMFTGFIDSGKTTFIQETLEDPTFNRGENVLVLVCEEGEEEYKPDKYPSKNNYIRYIDNQEELTAEYLSKLREEIDYDSVLVEYNGMWLSDVLYNNMPEDWVVYQEMNFQDANTFQIYNSNMRNLMVDKLKSASTVVFKNFNKEMDKMPFHKVVRAVNRRCEIIYEYGPNDIELDTIEDPLPYDMNLELIEIDNKDYAIWYADINENEDNYYGKTFKISGRSLIGGGLKEGQLVFGRHIMTCCVEDIQFGGLAAKYENTKDLTQGGWVRIVATVEREYTPIYKDYGPVLYVKSLEHIDAPEEEVATFY